MQIKLLNGQDSLEDPYSFCQIQSSPIQRIRTQKDPDLVRSHSFFYPAVGNAVLSINKTALKRRRIRNRYRTHLKSAPYIEILVTESDSD